MKTAGGPAFDPYRLWLQVSESARPPTHYQLLGLSFGERDPDVIRQANLMRSAYVRNFQKGEHGDAAARILEELAEASRVLLDAQLRVAYEAEVKPATAPKPIPFAAAEPVVAPPWIEVEEYPGEAERRPRRKKRRRSKSRRSMTSAIGWIAIIVVALGGVGYVATQFPRQTTHVAEAKAPPKEIPVAAAAAALQKPEPRKIEAPAPPPPIETVSVRLAVDPPDARLTLEPIGDVKPTDSRASLQGEGAERTIVGEKGALPLVVAASAPGHLPSRFNVFASDVGRLVVVKLKKERPRDPLDDPSLPTPWKDKGKRYRMVADFRALLPISSAKDGPVWRYTTERPADDWTSWSFDDSGWAEGQAAFGTALGDAFRPKSGRNGPWAWGRTRWETPELWMRISVELPRNIRYGQIRWSYRCDDTMTVYVNGRHEFSEARTLWHAQEFAKLEHFVPGRNVIAVHAVNKAGPGLVDVGFEWLEIAEVK